MLRKIGLQFRKPSGFLGSILSGLMIKGNRFAYDSLISDFNIQPTDKILEIGYGPGIGIQLLSNQFKSCTIHGIDFSALMYKKASKRNKAFIDKKNVNLMLGDFLDTDLISGTFDKIYCLNVVYFWEDLQKPFERIKALLNEDGIFSFFMAKNDDLARLKFTKDDIFNKYSIEQILESLKLAGFSKIEYKFNKGYFVKAKK